MENHKRELIVNYLTPVFGNLPYNREKLLNRLMQACKVNHTVEGQELEIPGSFEEARVWFSISAMVHSYYFHSAKGSIKGTRIWKKREFVLFSSCLLEKAVRTDYVQILERGEVLSFSYAELLALMEEFQEVAAHFRHVFTENEKFFHNYSILLTKNPEERVREFVKEHALFIKCTSQKVQAMHVNLSLRAYFNQLNKLK